LSPLRWKNIAAAWRLKRLYDSTSEKLDPQQGLLFGPRGARFARDSHGRHLGEDSRRLAEAETHGLLLDIDNNEGENAVRGICLGRRNWLFCGSDRGGRAAAVCFSLLASCKRHGHDPFLYLRDVLTRLPALLPAATPEVLGPLLPHLWKPV